MRSIAAAVFAGICALAFVFPAHAESTGHTAWSRSSPAPVPWLTVGATAGVANVAEGPSKITKPFAARAAAAAPVKVVELPVEPQVSTRHPSFLDEALATFRDAQAAARAAVAQDPRLSATLKADGFAVDDVLAVTRAKDGTITVFVGAA